MPTVETPLRGKAWHAPYGEPFANLAAARDRSASRATSPGGLPSRRGRSCKAAYQHIAELKAQDGKDILITGSKTLWNDLLAHDLIDEIHLLIGSRILGQGVPVFEGKTPASLRLMNTRQWENTGHVLLHYEVLHEKR